MTVFVLIILLIIALIGCAVLWQKLQNKEQNQSHLADIRRLEYEAAQKERQDLAQRKTELELESARLRAAIAAAERESAEATEQISAAQRACGLESALNADEFCDWLRKAETARQAQAEMRRCADDRAPLIERATALKSKFLALNEDLPFLAAKTADLAVIISSAREKQKRLEKTQDSKQAAAEVLRQLCADIERKQQSRQNAQTRAAEIEAQREDILRKAFGDSLAALPGTAVLGILRKLYAEKQSGAQIYDALKAALDRCKTLRQKIPEAREEGFHIGGALSAAQTDKEQRDEAHIEKVKALSAAQERLSALRGDAEIAELSQEKQALGLELQECARQYLTNRLGIMIARAAIARYRDSHRTGMMQAAEKAFAELTQGVYPRLDAEIVGNREVLQAADRGGALKRAEDMSKGTRFQLYMALRAAAYEQLLAQGKNLPFFCDDIFETFDEERTEAACRLMQHIGRQGQAIYLTHHRHVVDIAQKICGDEVTVHSIH